MLHFQIRLLKKKIWKKRRPFNLCLEYFPAYYLNCLCNLYSCRPVVPCSWYSQMHVQPMWTAGFFSVISWELFYTPESPEMTELDQSRARVRSSAWVAALMCPNIIWWCSEKTCYCDKIHQKEEKCVFREMMSPENLRLGQVHVYTWSYLKKCPWLSINEILLTCLWWKTIIRWIFCLLGRMSNF